MTELRLIETAGALGLYVLCAGMFATVYAVARLKRSKVWLGAAAGLYALHASICAGVVAFSPLEIGWKALLLASSLAVLVIPPLTWRLLQRTHSAGLRT